MKKFICDFVHRGLIACGFGPIVLAVIYLFVQRYDGVQAIPVNDVVISILTSALLAFIAGGINAIYKIERLPLAWAILIHAIILYLDYIVIYLVNDWMKAEFAPLTVFTICFFAGFAIVWAMIYFHTKRNADKLNQKLAEHQKKMEMGIRKNNN